MKLLLASLLALATSTLPARADTTYTYTGNSTVVYSPLVTGYFTTATPLSANRPLTSVTVTSFYFQGAGNAFSTGGAIVSTDAAGNIVYWYINLLKAYGGGFYTYLMSVDLPTLTFDINTQKYEYAFDSIGGSFGYVGVPNNPGTWTVTQTGVPLAPTPEPTTLLLACTALLALPLCAKRTYLRA